MICKHYRLNSTCYYYYYYYSTDTVQYSTVQYVQVQCYNSTTVGCFALHCAQIAPLVLCCASSSTTVSTSMSSSNSVERCTGQSLYE